MLFKYSNSPILTSLIRNIHQITHDFHFICIDMKNTMASKGNTDKMSNVNKCSGLTGFIVFGSVAERVLLAQISSLPKSDKR